MTPQTVNAVNLPLQNAMNFPAAILNPPFYLPGRRSGPELRSDRLGHRPRDQPQLRRPGRPVRRLGAPRELVDARGHGALQAPWANASSRSTTPTSPCRACTSTASSRFPRTSPTSPAWRPRTTATGLAYAGKPLPDLDGFTADQRFFIGFGQAWRTKDRPEALRVQLMTDGHAPGEFRADTVRNVDAWYGAFDVLSGQKLYLSPEARVKVW